VFEDWIIDLFMPCEACLQAEVVTCKACHKAQ
jgi:hypothetical protein